MDPSRVQESEGKAPAYAYYALVLLILANFLNYVDRHIISIVAEHVKADLKLTDAQLGFLMGTAFAMFYGISGIAMGRISDAMSRTKLMAFALTLWSGLTALSGAATSFGALALARIGVGLGESAASPCSQALIAEFFPPQNRATAMSLYLLGVFLGGAASLFLGALVLQHWTTMCTYLPFDACGLADWRAAFLAVGLPGIVLAIFVYRLREPTRPRPAGTASLAQVVLREMSAAVPPFTLFNLADIGGRGAAMRNIVLIVSICCVGAGLTLLTGDLAQWVAVGVGTYSVLTWAQIMKLRDPPLHRLTFGDSLFVSLLLANALCGCIGTSVGAWSPPYAMRVLGASPVNVGVYLGLAHALGAALSVPLAGWVCDKWRKRDVRAPIWIGMIGLVGSIPFLGLMMVARDLLSFSIANLFYTFFCMAWIGAAAALVQDLVLPRMRGAASAGFTLVAVVSASGLGPYTVGKISGQFGSLAAGLIGLLVLAPVALILFVNVAARLPTQTSEYRLTRAKEAGESL